MSDVLTPKNNDVVDRILCLQINMNNLQYQKPDLKNNRMYRQILEQIEQLTKEIQV